MEVTLTDTVTSLRSIRAQLMEVLLDLERAGAPTDPDTRRLFEGTVTARRFLDEAIEDGEYLVRTLP